MVRLLLQQLLLLLLVPPAALQTLGQTLHVCLLLLKLPDQSFTFFLCLFRSGLLLLDLLFGHRDLHFSLLSLGTGRRELRFGIGKLAHVSSGCVLVVIAR